MHLLTVFFLLLIFPQVQGNKAAKTGQSSTESVAVPHAASSSDVVPDTTTTTSTSTAPPTIPHYPSTNLTSINIRPEIGDAINIFRSYLECLRLSRAQEFLPRLLINDIATHMSPTLENQIESILSGLEVISSTATTAEPHQDQSQGIIVSKFEYFHPPQVPLHKEGGHQTGFPGSPPTHQHR